MSAECYTLFGKGGAVSSSSGSYSRYHNEPMNNLKILHSIPSKHWLLMTSRCCHVFILRTIPLRTYACQTAKIIDSAMKKTVYGEEYIYELQSTYAGDPIWTRIV